MNKSEIVPWLFSGWRLPVLLGLFLLICLAVWWAYSDHGISKTERNDAVNIGIDEGKNAVIGNLITNQEQVVNNATENLNRANANLANSLKRDTNSYSGTQRDADDAFCGHFPDDSSCADWRLRHGR